MIQLDLFDAPRARRIDPHGAVCADEQIAKVVELGNWRSGLRIELATHDKGWMWGISYQNLSGGEGFRVGEKWGRFAPDARSAFENARAEILERCSRSGAFLDVAQLVKSARLN